MVFNKKRREYYNSLLTALFYFFPRLIKVQFNITVCLISLITNSHMAAAFAFMTSAAIVKNFRIEWELRQHFDYLAYCLGVHSDSFFAL